MSIKLLYQAIETKMDTDFGGIVSYQYRDADVPKSIGIYLMRSVATERDMDGNILHKARKAHIEVTAGKSEDELFAAMDFLEEFAEKMVQEESETVGVEFVYCVAQEPISLKNKYDMHECVCDIDIRYNIY